MSVSNDFAIEPYQQQPAAFAAYDPAAAHIAAAIAGRIEQGDSRLTVHHIGSTAIPGCGGKGYIDLLLTYRGGELDAAKAVLATLGFERQQSKDPFPEERPMRVGAVRVSGVTYPVHVHVVAADAPEVEVLLRFRDRLRDNAALCRAYEAEKQRILASGVTDGGDYANAKTAFISEALNR